MSDKKKYLSSACTNTQNIAWKQINQHIGLTYQLQNVPALCWFYKRTTIQTKKDFCSCICNLQVRQPAFLFFAYQDLEGLVNDKVNN